MADKVRIELGFDGGQVMGAHVDPGTADALEQALGAGQDGAFSLDVDEGRYTIALARLVYVKRFSREGRVGFGA